jgi:Myb/SANT-like DNA-binding domain
MPRATTRTRRPPNREPASLAAIPAAVPAASENEAIDTVETLTPDANIDPALQPYDIDPPPPPTYEIEPSIPPSQFLDSLDPDYDDYHLHDDSQYPPAYPTLSESREITWSPSPPPPALPIVIQPQGGSLQWTFKMEEILLGTLVEEVNSGKRADSGFKSEAWTACCTAITNSKATKQLVTVEKCKSKVEAMKALWRELKWLKDQSGFGWDEATGLVQADDQVWKDVIKVGNL